MELPKIKFLFVFAEDKTEVNILPQIYDPLNIRYQTTDTGTKYLIM